MEDKVMYTEFIKMAAGRDETSGRKLYKDQKSIVLTAKIFIAVNDLPSIEDKTHGFWRKLVLIPFDAKFVDAEPQKDNERRLIDGFETSLLKCADTFLALLIKTYVTAYATEGVRKSQHPKVVKELSQKNQESQDIPLQFVNACVKESTAEKAHIRTRMLEQAFSQFCKGKGIARTSHLVRHLYELMDNRYPPRNETRQNWIDGKNVRAWTGAMLEIEQEEQDEQETETNYEEVDREFVRNQRNMNLFA
ncbi:hypothetical protein HDV00_008958 [Rhizophlyctis rosea]|nr:hypothetical protein HDV00_008958 [Rhizophlyctis rosea]